MKVFISWSGERSKLVALALNELLPAILQPVECWMSEESLQKGKPWFDQLRKELDQILFGVFCVTGENQDSWWMQWEAGFLSSSTELGDRRVAPFAIGLAKGEITGPLSIYQATEPTREDVLRLVKDINSSLPDGRSISERSLTATFTHVWPTLEKRLQEAIDLQIDSSESVAPIKDRSAEIVALLRESQRQVAVLDEKISNLPVVAAAVVPSGAAPGSVAGYGVAGGYGTGPGYGSGSTPTPTPTIGTLYGVGVRRGNDVSQLYSIHDVNTPLSLRTPIPGVPEK
jgi:hypothetical protein